MQQRSRKRSGSEAKRAAQDAPVSLPNLDTRRDYGELIARAAYGRYEARGREDGHDMEDWLEAEREIRGVVASGDNTPGDDDAHGPGSGQAA